MPRTKKPPLQKKIERQENSRPGPRAEKSQAIKTMHQKMEIIRLLDLGYDDQAIADHLGINTPAILERLKNEILLTLTPAYLDAVDRHRARSFQRYERLYRVAEAMATGTALPERDLLGLLQDMPQKDWMKIALSILDAETNLMKYDLDMAAKRAEEEYNDSNYTELQSSTLNLSSELAKAGRELIKETWNQDEIIDYIYKADPLPPTSPSNKPEQLLEELDPREIHEQLRKIQNQLHKTQLNEPDEGGDSDS